MCRPIIYIYEYAYYIYEYVYNIYMSICAPITLL